MDYGTAAGGSYGCQEWAAPDQCTPMNWYCDGWCQEACHDDWSLTWEWDQEAADRGDWENASVTVCQKCVVPETAQEGKNSYFVWGSGDNKRICAVGEAVHKEPAPDALRNDWGYDWCEWPAQMDWNKPEEGCYKPSCPHTGFNPQWGQTAGGSEMDYAQICLDQEPEEELGCPPGMSTMSVWEEGEEMNDWGYYNWEENHYCVKTREMKSLKTARDDLHKVFHYYDWIVEEEEQGEEPIEEFPEEALTEDFDTTDGDWVEKEEYPEVWEGSEEEYLAEDALGFEDSGMNEHDVEPMGEWEEEHHDVDPNLDMQDSGMFEELSTSPETIEADSGFWDEEEWGTEVPAAEHQEEWDSGFDTAATTATTAEWDSGFGTELPATATAAEFDSGFGTELPATATAAEWDSGFSTELPATATAAEWDSGFGTELPATAAEWDSGFGTELPATATAAEWDSGATATQIPTRKHRRHRRKHKHNRRRYDPAMMYGSGMDTGFDSGFPAMDTGIDSGDHWNAGFDSGFPAYDSGFGDFPTNDFGDYGYEQAWDSGMDMQYPTDYGYEPAAWDSGMDMYYPTYDSGMDDFPATFAGYGSGMDYPTYDSGMEDFPATFAGYGSGMPKRRKHRKHNRHH